MLKNIIIKYKDSFINNSNFYSFQNNIGIGDSHIFLNCNDMPPTYF